MIEKIKNCLNLIKVKFKSFLNPQKVEINYIEDNYEGLSIKEEELLRKSVNLINNTPEVSSTVINTFNQNKFQLSINEPFSNREEIYKTINREDKLSFIVYDIENLIFPYIKNSIENNYERRKVFQLLENVISYYEDYKSKLIEELSLLKTKDDVCLLLSILNIGNYNENYIRSLNLMNTINSIVFDNEWIFINQLISNLEKNINDFHDALLLYLENFDNDSMDIIKSINEEMKETLSYLENSYQCYLNTLNFDAQKNQQKEYENIGYEFYQKCSSIKNVFCFLDTENETIVSKDINEESRLLDKDAGYKMFVNIANECVSSTFSSDNGHLVKNKNYSESFLKKYHIRSYPCGTQRLFIGRYNTNLHNILPEKFKEPVNILYVYGFMFGNIDGNAKSDINATSIIRCYKNKNKIDEIMMLLNTDISNLSDLEKENVRKKVLEYLNKEMTKMGQIVAHTLEMNTKKKR